MKRELKSFGYAWKGFGYAIATQRHMRFHLFAACCAVAFSWWLDLALWEWCWIVACVGVIWCAELFNTAIELLVDLVSPEQHPIAGRVKDVAAAAVLVLSVAVAIIALIIWLPHI